MIQWLLSFRLLPLFIGCFLGSASIGFQQIFFAIDFYPLGPWGISSYYLIWFTIGGLILFPLYTFCRTAYPSLFLPLIFISEIVAISFAFALIGKEPAPIVIGTLQAFLVTGYFQLYHLAIAGMTSRLNRSRELAIAKLFFQSGGILGGVIGGVVVDRFDPKLPYFVTSLIFIIATFLFAAISPKLVPQKSTTKSERSGDDSGQSDSINNSSLKREDSIDFVVQGEVRTEPLIDVFRKYPRQLTGVLFEVFISTTTSAFISILLIQIGLAPIMIGFLHSVRFATALLLTPICQRSVNRGKGLEFTLASIAGIGGWLILIFGFHTLIWLMVSAVLIGIYTFLFVIGLEARWYARRSMTQILARELILGVGRIIAIPPLAWAVFYSPNIFMLIGISCAAMIYWFGRWLMACERESLV